MGEKDTERLVRVVQPDGDTSGLLRGRTRAYTVLLGVHAELPALVAEQWRAWPGGLRGRGCACSISGSGRGERR